MKRKYQVPKIVDEHSCEAQALGCPKIPGIGDPAFCGGVWTGSSGKKPGCSMSTDTRSS